MIVQQTMTIVRQATTIVSADNGGDDHSATTVTIIRQISTDDDCFMANWEVKQESTPQKFKKSLLTMC